VTDLRLVHTADLDAATRAAVRAMLDDAFDGDFSDQDWEHALGGMHALAWDGDELAGHASVVQRRLLYGGRALRAGYVEAVGVRSDQRRRGHGAALMEAIERVIRGAYELGALASTEVGAALYVARGWQRWEGPTSVLSPDGIARTRDNDDAIYVLPVATPLDRSAALVADWRDGDAW
jgi:aminoglycoside 2'-N-acetyltransferase I